MATTNCTILFNITENIPVGGGRDESYKMGKVKLSICINKFDIFVLFNCGCVGVVDCRVGCRFQTYSKAFNWFTVANGD